MEYRLKIHFTHVTERKAVTRGGQGEQKDVIEAHLVCDTSPSFSLHQPVNVLDQ